MHPGTLKTLILVLALSLALRTASLRAQTFTAPLQASTSGANPVDFEFRTSGLMIAKGSAAGGLFSTDQGAGIRLLWYPAQAAFRAGEVTTTQWNSASIGDHSAAFGLNTIASNRGSSAFGVYTTASGYASTAFGNSGVAAGGGSVVMGRSCTSSNYTSMAFGFYATSSGMAALATGGSTTASGSYAFAANSGSLASGSASTAFGNQTTAAALDSFALGTYNLGGGTATAWVGTDPLFEIGNGTSAIKSDALVVYKNGNAAFQGVVTVAPGGDIPMYTGQ